MPSQFLEDLKAKIGADLYGRLSDLADEEVGLAMKMPLVDEYREKKYYHQRALADQVMAESHAFSELGLNISPLDVVTILFRCRTLFACKNEDEYQQRVTGSYVDEVGFSVPWARRSDVLDSVIESYFDRLEGFLGDRTLITEVSHFDGDPAAIQKFFDDLFAKMGLPCVAFIDESSLVAKQKVLEPGLRTYTEADAKRYFNAPSIGFKTHGSYLFGYLYGAAWLRTFFNLLRIGGFIYPGQIDFGRTGVPFTAPTSPVLLGHHSSGCYVWDEDMREPWSKIPDGTLFLSFGYRGLAKMWLDTRTFGGHEKFLLENRSILDYMARPWDKKSLYDIAPTLDMLSSAAQMPDLGGKILLLYCSLEHLFVPSNTNSDNKKYIVGGINALNPDLLPWFNKLYKLRCEYAHRGYVIREPSTRSLIVESMVNITKLLVAKLGIR